MQQFVDGRVAVRVPATSANLGPGFDSYGLALALFDTIAARVVDGGLHVVVDGEGRDTLPRDETHLVWQAMQRLFDDVGGAPPGVELVCSNQIPHGRGLGSSAAAIVGGLAVARALLADVEVGDQRLLELATELEGHPDNVAAAIFGGFTVAWTDPDSTPSVGAARLDPHPRLRAVVVIPLETLSTKQARAVLPSSVPHCDAVTNVARAGLLVEALTRRPDLLLPATYDRLHQEQRREAYPETWREVELLREQGLAAVVSGAGPTVLVLGDRPLRDEVAAIVGPERDVRELAIDPHGVTPLT